MMLQHIATRTEQDMGKVINRLAEVKARKEKETGQVITWERVANETGLAYTTVMRYAKDQADRFDGKVIAKLCEFFGVGVGDILEYVDE